MAARRLLWLPLLLAITLTPAMADDAGAPAEGDALVLNPPSIEAGMWFAGTHVSVEAVVPPGSEAAVLCLGPRGKVDLQKKERAMGFLWVAGGEVEIEEVPLFYQLLTSKKLDLLAPAAELERLGLGYAALGASTESDVPEAEWGDLFREFTKLKEKAGHYAVRPGTVKIEAGIDGSPRALAQLWLPADTPLGVHEVRVFSFRAGRGELAETAELRVTQSGVAAATTRIAREHGLAYGIAAVIVALAVGLATGMIFGLASKKGH